MSVLINQKEIFETEESKGTHLYTFAELQNIVRAHDCIVVTAEI